MCVLNEVAGLPGGQPLADLATQVQGSPSGLSDLASSWNGAATDVAANTSTVMGAASQLGQTWRGASSSNFSDLMAQFGQAGDNMQQSLSNAGAALSQVATAFDQVKKNIDTLLENLLTHVSQLRAANPNAAAGDLDGQIRTLVAETIDEVRAAITSFEQVLNQASNTLGAEVPGLGHTFSALSQPGSPGQPDTSGGGGLSSAAGSEYGKTPANGTGGSGYSGPGTVGAVTPGGNGGGSGPVDAVPPDGNGGGSGAGGSTDSWINRAIGIMKSSGVPASALNPQDLALIIQHESGGDPSAVNHTDYNAAAGTPSTGLMQTIGPTFTAYALPGHTDITNPVDNIIAGTRYALARYGSLDNVPGVLAVHSGRPYVGY